jgi:hypothetical protein
MSILFVSAFKDIGRSRWPIYTRSNEEYIRYFMDLAMNIKYKLIVFIEPHIREILVSKQLPSNIILLDCNLVRTFYDKFIESETTIMNSQTYKNKIPSHRKTNPEHWNPEYNLVNHNKINYVAYCRREFPEYEFYSWLDFGCIRNAVINVPKNINYEKLHCKISYLVLVPIPSKILSANEMLHSHTVYLAGSQFVVHKDLVEKFEKLYEEQLLEWQAESICDDDQNLVLQIYNKNKDIFELFPSNEWFTLFSRHLNKND